MEIRFGKEQDLKQILEIDNFYIENRNYRFESNPLSLDEKKIWFSKFSEKTKNLIYVATNGDEILGYCSSKEYRPEKEYKKTLEISVYVKESKLRNKIGTKLYNKLFSELKKKEVKMILCGIEMDNKGSIEFHKKFGFEVVGTFRNYIEKNSVLLSATWMQMDIKEIK